MSKDSGIDFNQKFTTYLSQNIKLNDLFGEKTKDKFKENLASIFNCFDSINKDGELDADEVKNIIKILDTNKDKIISEEEIDAYSKTSGLNKKFLKAFIELINYNLSGKTSESEVTTCPRNSSGVTIISNNQKFYTLKSTNYGAKFIKYDTNIQCGSAYKNSAIYDIQNDRLLPINTKQPVEIIGVKNFLEKQNENIEDYPKIIIKGEDGKNTEIEMIIGNINMSRMEDEDDYIFLMTNLTSALSSLPSNVLEDLKNNVKYINLKPLEFGHAGEAHNVGYTLKDYNECIRLNSVGGLFGILTTLTHEIGHTVDNNIMCYVTDKNAEQLQEFIDNLPLERNRNIYALTNPKELFAEYYTYTSNIKDKSDPRLKEVYQFFKELDDSLNNGDSYGWGKIKTILDGVKNESIKMTEEYRQKVEEHRVYFEQLNSADGAIPEDKMSQYDSYMFWNTYNDEQMRDKFEQILENYPEFARVYYRGTANERLAIINKMRNHPNFKPVLEECFNKFDVKKEDAIKFENLSFNDALVEIERNFNQQQKQKLRRDKVEVKLNEDSDVLSSDALREVLAEICANSNEIPKSIRDKYQAGSTEPITKEVVLALRNQPNMWYFLIFEKNYFKHH